MKVRRFISAVFFLIGVAVAAFAQEQPEVHVSMEVWQEKENLIKDLSDSISVLNDTIAQRNQVMIRERANVSSIMDELKKAGEDIDHLHEIIKRNFTDSISRQQELDDLKTQIITAQKKIERADTITIQMIVTYMNLKCSEKKILNLRKEFANISKQELKTSYKSWDDLLSVYIITYNTIKEAAKEVSEKISSASMPPLRKRYVNECRQRLETLRYYNEFYNNNYCTSPYLNEMLDLIIRILASPDDQYDFSIVLEK